mmetsp:Transcript_151923/g.487582  ORF Transcript_151923/g.487582 Transcript_151923/m.487582 type:complete len:212 (-) Transcript_151923:2270-2905(-)
MNAEAACCALPAPSHNLLTSDVSNEIFSAKAFVASTASSTFFSAIATLPSPSRFTVAILRSVIPRFVAVTFFATTSNRPCKFDSSSAVLAADVSERRFAAKRFMAKNVFAPPTAVCATLTAASSSMSNLLKSSGSMSSTPFKKGSSAAATFWKLSSASLMRSSDSLTMPSMTIFSDVSFMVLIIALKLSCASAALCRIFSISSLAELWALP